jgi:phage shock protein C
LSSSVFNPQFGRLESGQEPSHVTEAPLRRIGEGKAISGLCLALTTRADLRVEWLQTVAFFLLPLTGGLLGVTYLMAPLFAPRIRTVSDYQVLLRRSRQ